jgi:hypothetical protein
MNESKEQKSGTNDPKNAPEKIVTPGSGTQSPVKPDSKQDPKTVTPSTPATPPLKADAGQKTPQK